MIFGIPPIPFMLGTFGFFPFVVAAVVSVLTRTALIDQSLSAQLLALSDHFVLPYALTIASFMAAIHWAWAMTSQHFQLGYWTSIGIALLAWVGHTELFVFVILFPAILVGDWVAHQRQVAPSWYWRLRVYLTTVVVLSLVALWL